ncbi:MAG: hypothetical protein LBT40_09060 [Deltaproteobacteria bacterium]|jgi:hypothetical protein|nr:hypothetical protein [Deltaproteobacteria bacterium]
MAKTDSYPDIYTDSSLQRDLDKAVESGYSNAKKAARDELGRLGVNDLSPPPELTCEEIDFRLRLRRHGRRLGDAFDGGDKGMERLLDEATYERFHRVLFARHLAERGILVRRAGEGAESVSLDECGRMAGDTGEPDDWSVAARLAEEMLPEIFLPESPASLLAIPKKRREKMQKGLARMPRRVVMPSDSLSYVFHEWRNTYDHMSERYDRSRDWRPALSQRMTDGDMVRYLLHNSVGAWWAGRQIPDELWKTASSGSEIWESALLEGVSIDSICLDRGDDGSWTCRSGTFATWPAEMSDFRIIDPCCGSGQFLVTAFKMLVPMRVKADSLSVRDAVDAVLSENVHGLDIDRRCVQLTKFGLMLSAWTYPGAGGYRDLPRLNVECSGLPADHTRNDLLGLAGSDERLGRVVMNLHGLFRESPVLGSLMEPCLATGSGPADLSDLDYALDRLKGKLSEHNSDEFRDVALSAFQIVRAASLLSRRYTLVVGNFPNVPASKQPDGLREFCEGRYPESKDDLSTVFVERCLSMIDRGGTLAILSPISWLFKDSYEPFRKRLLDLAGRSVQFGQMTRDFESWNDIPVRSALLITSLGKSGTCSPGEIPGLSGQESVISPIEPRGSCRVQDLTTPAAACSALSGELSLGKPLNEIVTVQAGTESGDDARFRRFFWEFPRVYTEAGWRLFQAPTEGTIHYGGRSDLIRLTREKLAQARHRGTVRYRRATPWYTDREESRAVGVAVSLTGNRQATLYTGDLHSSDVVVLIPRDVKNLAPLWCCCSSLEFEKHLQGTMNTKKFSDKELLSVPFDSYRWEGRAWSEYDAWLPFPYSDDPTQWTFHGHPFESVLWNAERKEPVSMHFKRKDINSLQIAVCRVMGYRWPPEIYGDIELDGSQRYMTGYFKKDDRMAGAGGILCIPGLPGRQGAVKKVHEFLKKTWGYKWSGQILDNMLKSAGFAGRSLEEWLRDGFFAQHCRMFRERPFIWQVWDGHRSGFSALINCHKLSHKLLETLVDKHLGLWIDMQKKNARKIPESKPLLVAAMNLKSRLKTILHGEDPYDIFVRWKSLDQQPVGYRPDISDGVRVNIRPFMTGPDIRVKGAGILRDKPDIDWSMDSGKDVPGTDGIPSDESAPWLKLFAGKRINDFHLKLSDKQKSGT